MHVRVGCLKDGFPKRRKTASVRHSKGTGISWHLCMQRRSITAGLGSVKSCIYSLKIQRSRERWYICWFSGSPRRTRDCSKSLSHSHPTRPLKYGINLSNIFLRWIRVHGLEFVKTWSKGSWIICPEVTNTTGYVWCSLCSSTRKHKAPQYSVCCLIVKSSTKSIPLISHKWSCGCVCPFLCTICIGSKYCQYDSIFFFSGSHLPGRSVHHIGRRK